MRNRLFHEQVLHKIRIAECLAELQEAGNLILAVELQADHVVIFNAWQDRWAYLKEKMARDKWCPIDFKYLDNDFYNLVLNEIRAQEDRARERFLAKLHRFIDALLSKMNLRT